MSRINGVSQGATSKVLHLVREASNLTQVLRRHQVKRITPKEDHDLLHIMNWDRFISASIKDQHGADQANSMMCLCLHVCMVQRRLVAVWYRSRHPDKCPRLTPGHSHWRHMLRHRYQRLGILELVSSDICSWVKGSAPTIWMSMPKIFYRVIERLLDCWIQETGWSDR